MAIPTLTVTFDNGTTTITLPAPPGDNDAPVTIPGVTHQTQGGSLVQYIVGPSYFEATLAFDAITNAQKNSLDSFFRSNWGTGVTYTDALGNTFTAHFIDQQLPLRKTFGDFWQCSIHLRLSAVLK